MGISRSNKAENKTLKSRYYPVKCISYLVFVLVLIEDHKLGLQLGLALEQNNSIRWFIYSTSCPQKYKTDDLPIQKDLNGFEAIPDLTEVELDSLEEFVRIYTARIKERKTGKTLLNEDLKKYWTIGALAVLKLNL